jgi:hypothetical protein
MSYLVHSFHKKAAVALDDFHIAAQDQEQRNNVFPVVFNGLAVQADHRQELGDRKLFSVHELIGQVGGFRELLCDGDAQKLGVEMFGSQSDQIFKGDFKGREILPELNQLLLNFQLVRKDPGLFRGIFFNAAFAFVRFKLGERIFGIASI